VHVEDSFIDTTNLADEEVQYANDGGIVRVKAVADESEKLGFGQHGQAAVIKQAFVNILINQGSIYMAEEG
jgi:hypothetical protein